MHGSDIGDDCGAVGMKKSILCYRYSPLTLKKVLTFIPDMQRIPLNNTPQAYPEVRLGEAQTGGLLLFRGGNAI